MQFKLLLLWVTIFSGLLLTGNWVANAEKAKISFEVHGPFGMVHGTFKGLKATIQFDEKDLAASSIVASIDAKTVSSGVSMRNSDLRNEEEWLNTDKYPTISFHSKKIEKTPSGYKASGELTLKATTKPIEIPFTFTSSGNAGVFKGQFKIKREDYKLGKNGGSVGDEITIGLEIPVKK